MIPQPARAIVSMDYSKETKNSYRYSPVNDRNPVGDVYPKKSFFANSIAGKKVRVTVEEVID